MATVDQCAICLRLIRRQASNALLTKPPSRPYSFPISNRSLFVQRPAPYAVSRLLIHRSRTLATQSPPVIEPPNLSRKVRQIAPIVPTKPASPSNKEITRPVTSPATKIANKLRQAAPAITETYVAYGMTEILVKECARQANYTILQAEQRGIDIPKTKDGEDLGVGTGWWYEELGLTPTFNNWAQVTFLHMYLLTTRIRCFPPDIASTWHQHLIDHFSYVAEERMVTLHNIQARMMRNRYLKDLFIQWRGLTAAYDEGIVSGDSVLAAAVWRNICKGDEDADLRKLGMIVAYIRSVLSTLDGMQDEAITTGDVIFGDPGSEAALVGVRSSLLDMQVDESGTVARPS